jgi:hypothetical protein
MNTAVQKCSGEVKQTQVYKLSTYTLLVIIIPLSEKVILNSEAALNP